MQFEEAIYNELSGDATVAAKVTAGGSRYHLYPLRVPEGVTVSQAITYTKIDESLTYPLVRTVTYQFNCVGDTFAKARALADDVNRIFDDRSETLLGAQQAIKYMKFLGSSQLYDTDAKLYVVPVEMIIKY